MKSLFARFVSPIIWRLPGHKAKVLYNFSLAEYGSMLDLSAAARHTPSKARSAMYIRHLSDELRHAELLFRRSSELRHELSKGPFGYPHADTEDIFLTLGEVRFLAFVHLGETRACRQFEVYHNWLSRKGDKKTGKIFRALLQDERRHAEYTWELLKPLAGGEREARNEIRKAAFWEVRRKWLRLGRNLANKLFFVLATALYFVSAPYAVLIRLFFRSKPGWSIPTHTPFHRAIAHDEIADT